MGELALAGLAFLAAHVAPAATGLRGALTARIGRPAYLALYSAVSLASLAWVIDAARRAPRIELWPTTPALALVAILAMIPACVLLAAAATRANPGSISFRGGPADLARPGVLALTRHPVLWAFLLWSGGHLAANGDLAAALLFGGAALFSLVGMRALDRRAARAGHPRPDAGPLRARFARALSPRLAVEALAGLALYAALLAAHGPVIGVWPLDWI